MFFRFDIIIFYLRAFIPQILDKCKNFFVLFYIFLCERRKGGRKDGRRKDGRRKDGRRKDGRRKGGGAFGVGWLKMGKPRGAGANAGEQHLVDEWFWENII